MSKHKTSPAPAGENGQDFPSATDQCEHRWSDWEVTADSAIRTRFCSVCGKHEDEQTAKRGRRQEDLPGVDGPGAAPVKIRELDKLADEYVFAKDMRITARDQEEKAKDALMAAMRTHREKLPHKEATYWYEYDDKKVVMKPKDETETLTVEEKKGQAEASDEEMEVN